MKKAMKSMKKKGSCIFLRISKFLFLYFNQNGKEGNEIDEKKGQHEEGNEVDEKKGTMKRRKAMKVSKIAKGKRAKSSVFRGRKAKTSGGLKKQDLIKSKSGKVVSKKMSDR